MRGKGVLNLNFNFALKGEGPKCKEIGFGSPGSVLENIMAFLKRVSKFPKAKPSKP